MTKYFTFTLFLLFLTIFLFTTDKPVLCEETTWECEVFPPESVKTIDPKTGSTVVFITTAKSNDTNLYFHDRSWLPDESMLIFVSDRTGQKEPFGYLEKTGELVRLSSGAQDSLSSYTAGKMKNSLFLVKDNAVCEWQIKIEYENDQKNVNVSERIICMLPPDTIPGGALNVNADDSQLGLILRHTNKKQWDISMIDQQTGDIKILASLDWWAAHLQCSWTRPDLIMFARQYEDGDRVPLASEEESPRARIWFVDTSGREPWAISYQEPGELVTHECWWINDQITFCGGFLPEESHVKQLDFSSGIIRIAGAGSWWPDGSSSELAKRNWWHASGSPTGEWIAADNWHGDIALFDARTTEMKLLTTGHRTYGGGAHPHVGWAPSGDRVVFTSNKRGNPDVCIAYLR